MKEVSLLRREIAPHLKFLEKQVEKIEKGKNMREELARLYATYFKVQKDYIEGEHNSVNEEENRIKKEIKEIEDEIASLPEESKSTNDEEDSLTRIEQRIFSLKSESGELLRKLGRVEGALESAVVHAQDKNYTNTEIESFFKSVNEKIGKALEENEVSAFKNALEEIQTLINNLNQNTKNDLDLSELEETKKEINSKLTQIADEENKLSKEISEAKENLEKSRENRSLANARRYEFNIKKTELNSTLAGVRSKSENLSHIEEDFKDEEKEAVAILGIIFKQESEAILDETINKINLKKDIERLKIKLEDYGSIGVGETLKEYEDTRERDGFLGKEMTDLEQSIESLQKLILELKEKIDVEFKEGIKKINVEFQEFFALMFGGGIGELLVISEKKKKYNKNTEDKEEISELINDSEEASKEAEETEEGIEINVSLPHKKVKELHALSGGERSLVSIALLFAMSQVNPPPFLVLDETDAALDEANSRKYGDMLEKLSKRSQLIVVTHNRETMSRAGVLYGVTVGSDGGSKLLSIKFEEAAAIAK
jgi:chromosome segregation protein